MSITGLPGNIPHQGLKERNPPELHISKVRAPTSTDSGANFDIGDIWIDLLGDDAYILVSKDAGVAVWAIMGGVPGGIQTINTLPPDGAGDFSILAGTNLTVVPGVNSITINADGTLSSSFPTDAGTATPLVGVLNVLGGTGIDTAGAGNTVTVNADGTLSSSFPTDAGTATPALGVLNVLGGPGIDTSAAGNTVTISTAGGGVAIDEINVDSTTGTGTNPVVPNGAGAVTFTGAQVAASAFANVININSDLPNQFEAQIQRSSAVAAADTTLNGVSHFDNTQFTVDADGFVQSIAASIFSWLDIGVPGALALDTGYFVTAIGAYTLPTGTANGQTVEIVDVVGGGVIVTAPGAQIIQLQNAASSAGGTATSTDLGDSLRLKFRLADLTWYACPGIGGNWLLA